MPSHQTIPPPPPPRPAILNYDPQNPQRAPISLAEYDRILDGWYKQLQDYADEYPSSSDGEEDEEEGKEEEKVKEGEDGYDGYYTTQSQQPSHFPPRTASASNRAHKRSG